MQKSASHGDCVNTPLPGGPGIHVPDLATYRELYRHSVDDPTAFWAEQALSLSWFSRWHGVLNADFTRGEVAWFTEGRLNVAHNCIDRHLPERAAQTAIIWEADEPGEARHITYAELQQEVCRAANALKAAGVRRGDRVIIYLPMVPELAYSMLACARIGAIHSIVFAGFSADSLHDRVVDCQPTVLITADEGLRGGKTIELKKIADRALEGLSIVRTVLVVQRTGAPVHMEEERDVWYHDAVSRERSYCSCEWMDSEDPLFILYTSGSTGKPKGVLHTQAGYLLQASLTHRLVFDYRPGEVYCCAADIGWITGHSYIIYGPLANGATTVMFESTPLYPTPERYWQMVETHRINSFYTAPTAIRALAREGNEHVTRHDRSSLRVLGTVGEPINPEAWRWYHDVVGEGRCPIVDTWWQTETGGMMITPLPGTTTMKPGCATLPFFGVQPVLVNDRNEILDGNDISGYLCINHPWPGMARTIWGDHQRFRTTYFSQYPGRYFTGDGCRRDEDGYYWITGRVDDVINVAGHRLGTAEIESALVASPLVSEAAVIGVPHEIKGTAIFAFVILSREAEDIERHELVGALKYQVREEISAIAQPDVVLPVPGLPKTRSGKIMRRILRKIAEGEYEELGNVSTLADPAIVDALIAAHKGLKNY
ncbi:MAG: acetate--CoA ligase [Calditrichaeota bacterium]|nr:acetate--CoA ligase [Candidatus Cloacimonadota bacterium]MCB1045863.1 acetate--CoA ligase [Calditrichota bacterium]